MNSHIYCDNCDSIQPCVEVEMEGTDASGKYITPTHLKCGECHYVIATTYSQPSPLRAKALEQLGLTKHGA